MRRFFFSRVAQKNLFRPVVRKLKQGLILKNLKKFDISLKGFFFSRNILIPKNLVGFRIFFHNGKAINSLKITAFMVGYKFSEFALLKSIRASKSVKGQIRMVNKKLARAKQ